MKWTTQYSQSPSVTTLGLAQWRKLQRRSMILRAVRHFRSHVKQKPSVLLVHSRERFGESKKFGVFFLVARFLALRKRNGRLPDSILVSEEPVHRNFQRAGHLFERVNVGHRVSVFDS